MSDRIAKLNSQFTKEISQYWQGELPEIFVSITRLETSPSLEEARVWLSFLNKQPGDLSQLHRSLPDLRRQLKRRLSLKMIPRFVLIEDNGIEYAEKISQTIKSW